MFIDFNYLPSFFLLDVVCFVIESQRPILCFPLTFEKQRRNKSWVCQPIDAVVKSTASISLLSRDGILMLFPWKKLWTWNWEQEASQGCSLSGYRLSGTHFYCLTSIHLYPSIPSVTDGKFLSQKWLDDRLLVACHVIDSSWFLLKARWAEPAKAEQCRSTTWNATFSLKVASLSTQTSCNSITIVHLILLFR